MRQRVVRSFPLVPFVLLISAMACTVFVASKPMLIIISPPSGSEFHEGEDIAVQSTLLNSADVVRVDLIVDGAVVRTDQPIAPQNRITFPLTQVWKSMPGKHILSIQAYNPAGTVSDLVAIAIAIVPPATPTTLPALPTPVASPVPPTATLGACADNAVFVADVTIPDGTTLNPGQAFNKTWRVRNTGCPWSEGYQLVFTNGEAMSATRAIPLPNTATGATADLSVAMTAPATPGAHHGTWRLRNAGGKVFGTMVTVVINVPGAPSPTPSTGTACNGTPVISSFTASPGAITAGGSTVLNWSIVTNADSVEIDQGIGEIATPGSRTVAPMSTTTYTLIARCRDVTVTAQVRVFVPFAIIGSVVYADTTDYTGACPKTVSFSGTITVNDAGLVTYMWESSDGSSNSPKQSINFDGPGAQTVSTNWILGTPGHTYSDYWKRLHILTPTDVISNNAAFTVRCN